MTTKKTKKTSSPTPQDSPSESDLPRVVGVAIKIPGTAFRDELVLSMPAPHRHHEIIRAARSIGIDHDAVDSTDEHQGFLLSDGTFANRKRALAFARHHNQLREDRPVHAGMLFSENLW